MSTQALDWQGRTVVDRDGQKIGSIETIYVDHATSRPEWAAVKTGWFGTKLSLVPLTGARVMGDEVRVDYDKDFVKGAPRPEVGQDIADYDEAELCGYYGVEYTGATPARGTRSGEDDAMTRSEEELRVGTTQREAGRARLRKWVETEPVSETVTTRRETARVEREPITEANVEQATRGPDISEAEYEATLTQEEPVVEKRTVPKERVRLAKDVTEEEETVTEEVRKERIDVEGDLDPETRGKKR